MGTLLQNGVNRRAHSLVHAANQMANSTNLIEAGTRVTPFGSRELQSRDRYIMQIQFKSLRYGNGRGTELNWKDIVIREILP